MDYVHAIATAAHDKPVFTDPAVVADVFRGFEAASEHGAEVAAYAFMSAHLHMLLGVSAPRGPGAAVQRILGPAAWCLNRRQQQRGAIFLHRFWRAEALDQGHRWILPLYIHANPAPRAPDVRRLSVGCRSSHDAWSTGSGPPWLRPGAALEQFDGHYREALEEYLARRASAPAPRVPLTAREECVLSAVAHVTGSRWDTLLQADRGGKRDRMLLVWALARDVGVAAAARVVRINPHTAARWVAAANEPEMRPWRAKLGATG